MGALGSRRGLALGAGLGSAGLLLAALGFQFLGGLAPCPLCITQRWPHLAAALLAGLCLVLPWRVVCLAGAGAAGTSAGLGLYHAGVEQGWWAGPDTCTAPATGTLSPADLLAAIEAAPIVRCDEIPWELLGLSMAGWNALASAGLAAVWLVAAGLRRV